MQLQIECNSIPSLQQSCIICTQLFEMTEARIIVCNEQGKNYGVVCPECLEKGFQWLDRRFQQLSKPKSSIAIQQVRHLKVPVGAKK